MMQLHILGDNLPQFWIKLLGRNLELGVTTITSHSNGWNLYQVEWSLFFCWLGHRKMSFYYPSSHEYCCRYITLWSVLICPHHFRFSWRSESELCFIPNIDNNTLFSEASKIVQNATFCQTLFIIVESMKPFMCITDLSAIKSITFISTPT